MFNVTEIMKSTFNSSKDSFSAQNLVLYHAREKCRQLNMLRKTYDYSYLVSKVVHPSESAVPEALCTLNNSYTFFAIDSLLYSHVARSLGIDLNSFKDLTTIVIFDNEVRVYVLGKRVDTFE